MTFNFEEIFRLIFERSNYGIDILDIEGRIVMVNDRFSNLLEYTKEEIINKSLNDILCREDIEDSLRLIKDLGSGKIGYYHREKRYVRKDGTILWARSNSFLIRDGEGNPYIMELIDDITKEKDIELELNKIYKAIEQLSDWVIITDKDGNIEYANKIVEDITGYKREELIGKNPRVFKSGKHSREFYRNLWNTILSGNTFYGTITNRKKTGELFELFHTITPLKDDRGVITHLVSTAKDITPEKLLMEKIECMSYTDPLTSLANRNFFIDRIRQEILEARGRKVFIVVIGMDIDNFSNINYTYGYLVGDSVLREVGKKFTVSSPEGYTVARLGSDEFGILATNIEKLDEINIIIHRILEEFSSPIEINGMSIPINISIGISIYPNDGEDPQTLLKNVDMAILESKNKGRNQSKYTFFSKDLNEKTERFLEIQRCVISSISKESLIIRYQPYFDIATREVIGIEALSRCPCVEEGRISTEELFNVLEETGMILEVGDWIIDRVFEEIKGWQYKRYNIVPISINISPIQFKEKGFAEKMEEKIKRYEINPRSIGIEITERVFMDNIDITEANLRRLKALGIKVSIDDFGKGYSSLSYLKRLSVDHLKIDISFIKDIYNDPDDASIVSAIISMAHNLGIKTVAEGVETEEQLKVLQLLRCNMAQGYLLSKPLLPNELERYLGREPLVNLSY